ncbi:MAG: outer membrane lipoprotein carrier protein LolA [Polyangiaceae bacterium]|nr:outer membrane lipoprotein carrier protein LolA [Polyangiaceae bacterium]
MASLAFSSLPILGEELALAGPKDAKKSVGASLSANELAERVQNFYDRTKSFRAKFKQRYHIAAHDKTKESQGDVVFLKPGKMSWRYKNGNRVVSDGQRIKVYEKDNQQLFDQRIDKSQYPAALSFLLGGGKIKDEFALKKIDAGQVGYEGGFVLLGVPKQATPAFQKILFYIDPATYQVRRVMMIDAQRNTNRFDFIQPAVNLPVDKKEFTFVPPAGTRVIKP